SVASEGAIDANAELLHELKTLPPGALTQTFLHEEPPEEATEELDVESLRESSIPRPQDVPALSPRSEGEARRPRTLHGYIAPQPEALGRSEQAGVPVQRGETSLQMAARALDRKSSPPAAQVRENDSQVARGARTSSPNETTAGERDSQFGARAAERQSPFASVTSDRESQVGQRPFLTQQPFASVTSERESHIETRSSDRRSTPVPALLSETPAQSDFPARLRSTPPAALRAVTEPRRSSSVPAQPRAAVGGAAAASQALRPAMQTQPMRLTPLPQLSESTPEEHTQEVHTIDLELHPTLSVPPLAAADDALSADIARAEQVLESDTSPERVRELAELYVKRNAEGDREQAADLFCTLGEVLGNPGGVAMLDRALALVPDHAEAKALLTRYAVRPRMHISSPKITVLGMPPKLAVPPTAVIGAPPPAAGAAASAALTPPAAAGAAQPMASAAPASVPAAARATVPGTGPMNDVLSLHGVPQVVTTRPSVPPIS
ncbi:MAG TPA: hypothetical protein VMF89_21685, partial [Polyangiales bacterium]|nr:hypothetical protein [Polyangiales bacterium]